MSGRGSVTSKCMRSHKKAEGRCTGRCLRWYYILEGPKGENDRRGKRQWSRGFPTKKAASEAVTAELARRDQGIKLNPSKMTIRQLSEKWLEHLEAIGRDERTRERYDELLDLHVLPYLGSERVRDLEPAHVSSLHAKLRKGGRKDGKPGGLSPRMVGHVHRAVHGMLRYAKRQRIVAINVAEDLELPPVPKSEMVTLTREQARTLLDAAEQATHRPWLHSLIMLGVATGSRLGELLALEWSDIDLEAGTVRIGKSARIVGGRMQVKGPKTESGYRTVSVGAATVASLRKLHAAQAARRLLLGADYHTDAELVICKADGRPYRPDSASTMFRGFVDAVGLPRGVHVHTLRHSAASFLAAAGVPASDIAAVLGHKDGGTLALRVYVHPMAEGIVRAGAELDQVVASGG